MSDTKLRRPLKGWPGSPVIPSLIVVVCVPIALLDGNQFVGPFCYFLSSYGLVLSLGPALHKQAREPLDDRAPSPWPDETGIVRWRRKRREKAAADSNSRLAS